MKIKILIAVIICATLSSCVSKKGQQTKHKSKYTAPEKRKNI